MALLLVNPVCGDASAPAFVAAAVRPLLTDHTYVETTSPAHAPAAVRALRPRVVILAAGDGTLHDVINGLHYDIADIAFVLVPCGTANALYAALLSPDPAARLLSLRAYLNGKQPTPLSLATTTVASPTAVTAVLVSAVVVSTALHASILHDSEALRAAHPSIERFKIAAQQNSTKWYAARLRLIPADDNDAVHQYDPATRAFRPAPASPGVLELGGPFVYFLATVNVDRLEPSFRIAPLARAAPRKGTCDVVVIRPLRDPGTATDTPAARQAFAAKTWDVLTAAYQDGAHINLCYAPDGTVRNAKDGPPVVEYLRCGGWEWIPDPRDPDAHLLCTDGAITHIPTDASALCTVDAVPHEYTVYA